MRKLNVWRMQKHILRNTPDTLDFTVDPMQYDAQFQAQHRLEQFSKRMKLKHGPDANVEATNFYADGDQLFHVKARVTNPRR